MSDDSPSTGDSAKPARKRDKAATERQVFDAALRLLARDGVLAGLNLSEVADEAGVNRGLIYQRYGSRQELLRAAILSMDWISQPVFDDEVRSQPFKARRQAVFESSLGATETFRLLALLALDGAEPLVVLPMLERTRKDLARDAANGEFADGVDPLGAHVLTIATYLGYAIFRDHFARDTGIAPEDLDRLAMKTFAQMLEGLTRGEQATATGS